MPKDITSEKNLDINKKKLNLLLVQTQIGKCFGKFNWKGTIYPFQ